MSKVIRPTSGPQTSGRTLTKTAITLSTNKRRARMDVGIFYEIQVASPLKHREREYQVFHHV